jgi:hypothetical protein
MKPNSIHSGENRCISSVLFVDDHILLGDKENLQWNIFFFQLASTVLICRPWPSLMEFSIHRHLVGLLGWGISPTQGLY